ncbi:hypothetical protein [uncultured Roseibium sp.]|jgi:hypothetical protein|uniref:hypothetical protein n=1 Tax=uncultured Roseibium sp. TaxID=1936171 RepID=UPI0026314A28|nr:hypothetical protein [uncultured Roseibium sp.]
MGKTYLYLLLALLLLGAASVTYIFVFSAPAEKQSNVEAQEQFMQTDPKDYPTTGGDEISVDFGK